MTLKRASFWVLLIVSTGGAAVVYDVVNRWTKVPEEERAKALWGFALMAGCFIVGIVTGAAIVLQSQD